MPVIRGMAGRLVHERDNGRRLSLLVKLLSNCHQTYQDGCTGPIQGG
jgi:hypothetical protein